MSRFLDNAQQILDTAELGDGSPVTILMRDGRPIGLSVVNDWSLDQMRAEQGADEAYRVSRRHGKLFVEGRTASQACLLTSQTPGQIARALLAGPVPATRALSTAV